MNQKTIEALNKWLGQYPESYHPYDMARFYEIFVVAAENNNLQELKSVELETYLRKNKKSWTNEAIRDFISEWELKIELCAGLVQHIRGEFI